MPSDKISVIVFDLGNVLLPFDYKIAVNKLNETEIGLGNKFINFYQNNYQLHRAFEKGKLSKNDFIDKMLNALNYKITADEFCEIYSCVFTENKEVIALLPKLKENYKLILLSNTNSIHKEYGWENYAFLKHFDKLILSHEVKSIKPEKEIYKCVENFTKGLPFQHLFIDDVLEYVNAAKQLGWDAIHFIGYEKLIKELITKKII